MHGIANRLEAYNKLKKYYDNFKIKGQAVSISALPDIACAHLIGSFCHEKKCRALVLVPNSDALKHTLEDLNNFGILAQEYPYRDIYLEKIENKSNAYEHIRLECLSNILNNEQSVVVSTLTAALQYTMPKPDFINNVFKLKVGQLIKIDELLLKLLFLKYENCDIVEGKGQFAVRGDIVDIYPVGYNLAVRLEFFDDEIESISVLDLETQRRDEKLQEIQILPAREIIVPSSIEKSELNSQIDEDCLDRYINCIYKDNTTIFDYLDAESVIFICDDLKQSEEFQKNNSEIRSKILQLEKQGEIKENSCQLFAGEEYFDNVIKKYFTVYLDNFKINHKLVKKEDRLFIDSKTLDLWNGSVIDLKNKINTIRKNKSSIIVVFAGEGKFAQNISQLLKEEIKIQPKVGKNLSQIQAGDVYVLDENLSSSFCYSKLNIYMIGRGYIRKGRIKKKSSKNKNISRDISSLEQLDKGDYVVHTQYGIGKFEGVQTLELQGITKDYLKISYAKSDVLYVPVTNLDLVSKYIGSKEGARVSLNKLGSTEWTKTKTRTKAQIKNIAKDLIKIYSKRKKTPGYAFPKDGMWQKDFEASFPFEETDAQLRCCEEIKKDMEQSYPMDRLLCGDVGFGKTEVALRAAFKCITSGKQCAILVPTTILAWQHYNTILERFQNFPAKVEMLSRFRTNKEQKEILSQLKSGVIDIIVGTHKLVQDNVSFRDLGLLIIDEEQRFGVLQKEKIKSLVSGTDILTLTATPIPRTLNMALSGIRDMSSLEDAPENRYPVQTQVLEYEENIIYEAIKKEISRGGQVYYLHNRIENLQSVATKLLKDIPELRLDIAHSRMEEERLSKVWKRLIDKEIDLLLCTSIIEAGVDVPNVNTLIVDDADKFGLAQLYQIRGRIGRSNKRAYAYFTFRKNKSLSEMAMKRLNAICDFTEFGSGFKISMKDLELRGAGNILGGEQHGHVNSVGYSMYVKLLNDALKEEKYGEAYQEKVNCFIDVDIQSHIPNDYIKDLNQRLEIYRKIADIQDEEYAKEIISEIKDRFGEIPKSLKKLIEISLIRSMASEINITEIRQSGSSIIFKLSPNHNCNFNIIIKEMGNRIKFNSGEAPCFSVSLQQDEEILALIKKVILLLTSTKEGD